MIPKALYITYLGISEPLSKAQVLPYLFGLSENSQIHLLSFEKKKLLKTKTDELRYLKEDLQKKGIIWHRLIYHKHPLIVSSFFDVLLGTIVSLFIIKRHRISIIHARSNIPVAIGYFLRFFLNIKLLYDRRGVMAEEHVENSGWKRKGILYNLAVWFEKKVILKSDAIVVLTKKARFQLQNNMRNNNVLIKTIPCCVDLQLFNYADRWELENKRDLSDKFILIYSGSLGTYNLLDEMFDFFTIASQMISNVHFYIMTQNRQEVLELIKKRKDINKSRVSVEYVSRDKLPSFLALAKAGLLFRIISPTAIAASPTKFAEYLACGVPVIAGPGIGDLEEIIKANRIGVVLEGYNKNEYARGINNLLCLASEGEALSQRCRRVAEDFFSLKEGVNNYLSIYNHLR